MSAEMILQRTQNHRGERTRKSVTIYLGACVMLTILLTGLVGLRLYSLTLEYRLARLQQETVSREDAHDRLEKELARLVSPSRVFAKATNDLGMAGSAQVAVVRIRTGSEPMLALAKNDSGEDQSADRGGSMLEGIMNLLTRKASARQ